MNYLTLKTTFCKNLELLQIFQFWFWIKQTRISKTQLYQQMSSVYKIKLFIVKTFQK